MPRIATLLPALVWALVSGASSAQQPVSRWGTLREVLRDGRTEARLDVVELGRPGTYALGALAGLRGELVVLDGAAWVIEPDGKGGSRTRPASAGDQATFAVAGVVEAWTEHLLTRDFSAEDLEAEIARLALEDGLDSSVTFPFLVEGKLLRVEGHVLAGACPFASGEPLPDDVAPRRFEARRAGGVLVGFLSADPPGVISHHGSRSHVHVLLDESGRPGGHLDGATIREGSVLKLPAPNRQPPRAPSEP